MPITQARMITLINAALDYQQALDKMSIEIARSVQAFRRNQLTAQQALDSISITCGNRAYLFVDEATATSTIAIERAHFASQMRRNEAARKWQEKQRRAAGIRSREDSSTSTSLFLPATPRQYPSSHQPQQQPQHQHQPPSPQYQDEDEPDFDPTSFQLQTGQERQEGPESQLDQVLPSTLTPHDIRRLELELAPTGHSTQVRAGATFEEDLLVCQCGFKGLFEAWQQHLANIQEE